MSMLGRQIKELRALACGLRNLYENGTNLTRVQVAGLTTAVEVMSEAADTIEGLRDRLQELQGEGGESNYTRLFGTPERAARVIVALNNCRVTDCIDCWARGACKYYVCGDDYDALLEWLEQEVDA